MKTKNPTWVISEEWAVDTDPYQWILYRRSHSKKTGKPGEWKAIKFFPRIHQLLTHLLHQEMRNNFDGDVVKSLDASYERVRATLTRFAAQLVEEGFLELKRPSRPTDEVERHGTG